MLATFIIGLREGLEAALIVGIVTAFLRQRGRADLLRKAMIGVTAAVLLCAAVGTALQIVSANLPQRQQEGLETVIGAVAVVMVTYMVLWMRRNSRNLRAQLEGTTSEAIVSGSGWALVSMAFLAVLREGLETAVFLIAAFNESHSGASAGVGAALGIAVAIVLGYLIYRGGVRINLSKFFRATGLVLVLVAAGLVMSAFHTAHEAGWITSFGQQRTVDLSSITRPGTALSSLLTGMLGIQDHPVRIEVIGWLVYLIPMLCYVAWPAGRSISRSACRRIGAATAVAAGLAAVGLTVTAPATAGPARPLTVGGYQASADLGSGATSTLRLAEAAAPGRTAELRGFTAGVGEHAGVSAQLFTSTTRSTGSSRALTPLALAQLNGGRLPLGLQASSGTPVTVTDVVTTTTNWWLSSAQHRLIDVQIVAVRTQAATVDGQQLPVGTPVRQVTAVNDLDRALAAQSARNAAADVRRRNDQRTGALALAALAVLGALLTLAGRTRTARPAPATAPLPLPLPATLVAVPVALPDTAPQPDVRFTVSAGRR